MRNRSDTLPIVPLCIFALAATSNQAAAASFGCGFGGTYSYVEDGTVYQEIAPERGGQADLREIGVFTVNPLAKTITVSEATATFRFSEGGVIPVATWVLVDIEWEPASPYSIDRKTCKGEVAFSATGIIRSTSPAFPEESGVLQPGTTLFANQTRYIEFVVAEKGKTVYLISATPGSESYPQNPRDLPAGGTVASGVATRQ